MEAKVALTRAVRERRLALGLSQASMAKALGTSQSRFSFIEKTPYLLVFLVPEGGLEPPHEFNPVADFKSAVSAISPLWLE